jgi:hypothetical protein
MKMAKKSNFDISSFEALYGGVNFKSVGKS